jgi:hypothetical protein
MKHYSIQRILDGHVIETYLNVDLESNIFIDTLFTWILEEVSEIFEDFGDGSYLRWSKELIEFRG